MTEHEASLANAAALAAITPPVAPAATQNTLDRFAPPHDGQAARALVAAILAEGFCISVDDGCEVTVKKSTDEQAILDALCTTGIDWLRIFKAGEKAGTFVRVGTFMLVYGNGPGELVSDYGWKGDDAEGEATMDRLANVVHVLGEQS